MKQKTRKTNRKKDSKRSHYQREWPHKISMVGRQRLKKFGGVFVLFVFFFRKIRFHQSRYENNWRKRGTFSSAQHHKAERTTVQVDSLHWCSFLLAFSILSSVNAPPRIRHHIGPNSMMSGSSFKWNATFQTKTTTSIKKPLFVDIICAFAAICVTSAASIPCRTPKAANEARKVWEIFDQNVNALTSIAFNRWSNRI